MNMKLLDNKKLTRHKKINMSINIFEIKYEYETLITCKKQVWL